MPSDDTKLSLKVVVDTGAAKAALDGMAGAVQRAAGEIQTQFGSAAEATQVLNRALADQKGIVASVGGSITEGNAAWGLYSTAVQQAAAAQEYLNSQQTAGVAAAEASAAAQREVAVAARSSATEQRALGGAESYASARIVAAAGNAGSLGYALASVARNSTVLEPILSAVFAPLAAVAFADIVVGIVGSFEKWYRNAIELKSTLSDIFTLDEQTAGGMVKGEWALVEAQAARLRAEGHVLAAAKLLQDNLDQKPLALGIKIKQGDLNTVRGILAQVGDTIEQQRQLTTVINTLQSPATTTTVAEHELPQLTHELDVMRSAAATQDVLHSSGLLLGKPQLDALKETETAIQNIIAQIYLAKQVAEETAGTAVITATKDADRAAQEAEKRVKAAAKALQKEAEKAQAWAQSLQNYQLGLIDFTNAARLKGVKGDMAAATKSAEEFTKAVEQAQRADARMDVLSGRAEPDNDHILLQRPDNLFKATTPDLTHFKFITPESAQIAAKAIIDIGHSFTTMMNGVMMGTERFSVAWRRMAAGIVEGWASAMVQVLTKKIANEVLLTATHVAGNEARVASDATAAAQSNSIGIAETMHKIARDAAKAASGAFQAVVGIPYIGPILAPPAAAAAYVGVMAMGALASAEGGQWRVPLDEQLTLLHRNEMVLPAAHAEALRTAVGGGGGTPTTSHIQFNAHVSAVDSHGLEDMLQRHGDKFMMAAHRMLRAKGVS